MGNFPFFSVFQNDMYYAEIISSLKVCKTCLRIWTWCPWRMGIFDWFMFLNSYENIHVFYVFIIKFGNIYSSRKLFNISKLLYLKSLSICTYISFFILYSIYLYLLSICLSRVLLLLYFNLFKKQCFTFLVTSVVCSLLISSSFYFVFLLLKCYNETLQEYRKNKLTNMFVLTTQVFKMIKFYHFCFRPIQKKKLIHWNPCVPLWYYLLALPRCKTMLNIWILFLVYFCSFTKCICIYS